MLLKDHLSFEGHFTARRSFAAQIFMFQRVSFVLRAFTTQGVFSVQGELLAQGAFTVQEIVIFLGEQLHVQKAFTRSKGVSFSRSILLFQQHSIAFSSIIQLEEYLSVQWVFLLLAENFC